MPTELSTRHDEAQILVGKSAMMAYDDKTKVTEQEWYACPLLSAVPCVLSVACRVMSAVFSL
jgi:hypothetical protein